MKTNTVVYGLSIAIIVILLIVAIVFIILDVKKSNKPPHPHPHPPRPPHPRPYPNNIGGETDKHGCYISAGYKWCKKKKKCIRPWEERC